MGLPAERRLRRGSDITAVVRGGSRARAGGLVVHAARRSPAETSGPRVGFVAPRTAGPAVLRNRARRRVQEQIRDLVGRGDLVEDVDLVVRILPAATAAGSPDLQQQLRRALGRLGVLDDARG